MMIMVVLPVIVMVAAQAQAVVVFSMRYQDQREIQ